MASPKLPRRVTAGPATVDGDRNHIQNLILLGLPADEMNAVAKKMEFVELPTHSVLHEAGEPLAHAYFINSGLASVLNVMTDGKSVEVGLAGKEGFIGLPLVVGLSTSPTQVIMQVAGSAYQLTAADFKEVLSHSPLLEKSLNDCFLLRGYHGSTDRRGGSRQSLSPAKFRTTPLGIARSPGLPSIESC